MKLNNKYFLPILLIILLSIFAILPLFHSGFFPIHDDTQVVRVFEMNQALRDGQFPVRTVTGLGYGFDYPIFNFYAPLPYYFGATVNFLTDALIATKIMFAFGIIFSGITMYLLGQKFWGKLGGLVCALFYIYVPYHAVDVYVRGAVGEFWALAFIPLVFYGLVLICKNNFWGEIIAIFGFTGVILSHNLTAMMLVPFIILAALLLIWHSKEKLMISKNLFVFLILSLGLTLFYWLPAFSEMSLTKVGGQIGGGADFHDHFVYLDQLWSSIWGYGGSAPGRLDGMSFMIGKIQIVVSLISLIPLIFSIKQKKYFQTISMIFIDIVLITSIIFTNQISQPIWEIIKIMAYFQYPWRFLILTVFATSFLSGSLVWFFRKNIPISLISTILLATGIIIANIKFFQPQQFISITASEIVNQKDILWHTSKISDEYLPNDFTVPKNENEVAINKINLVSGQKLIEKSVYSNEQNFIVSSEYPSEIILNTAYFPWWEVYLNQTKKIPDIKNGRIVLNLNSGFNDIKIIYCSTLVQQISNYVSLLSLIVIIIFITKPTKIFVVK